MSLICPKEDCKAKPSMCGHEKIMLIIVGVAVVVLAIGLLA